jgi:flagellar hook-associated protein FlgK
MHQHLAVRNNSKAIVSFLFYISFAVVAFIGNFNSIFMSSMEREFLRRDLDENYLKLENLKSNIGNASEKTTQGTIVSKIKTFKQSLEEQMKSGFGPSAGVILDSITKLIGQPITMVPGTSAEQLLSFQNQIDKALEEKFGNAVWENQKIAVKAVQNRIKKVQEKLEKDSAYKALDYSVTSYNQICTEAYNRINKPELFKCEPIKLKNPQSEAGKISQSLKLALENKMDALIPFVLSFLIDFSVPLLIFMLYLRPSKPIKNKGYGVRNGHPDRGR